jgi:hypothetical protein
MPGGCTVGAVNVLLSTVVVLAEAAVVAFRVAVREKFEILTPGMPRLSLQVMAIS